jgi:hypothetical protein
VTPAGFFRVHLHPKRFPRAIAVDWHTRILANTEDYVAVNKPWGVQVPHRVDNVKESLVACVTKVLLLRALPRCCACFVLAPTSRWGTLSDVTVSESSYVFCTVCDFNSIPSLFSRLSAACGSLG